MSASESGALVPTDLTGGTLRPKTPQDDLRERMQAAAEDYISVSVPVEETDPSKVDPMVPLLVTNVGPVPAHVVLRGTGAVVNIHQQILESSQAWAAEHNRELRDIVISWEVKLQGVAITPVLVMPDPTGLETDA